MAPLHSIALDFPPLRRSIGSASETPKGIISSFIVGAENAELLEILRPESIVDLGERSPVFLYGGSGVGKSVLALTVAGRWAMAVDHRLITATTGADFARQYANACEADDMDRFRQRHRDCRFLVIDGIHDLVGKSAAQEELVYTLDVVSDRRTPVVVTGPKLPGAIRGLRAALSSRLMSGTTIQVLPPGKEARGRILEEINRELGAMLTREQLTRLADQLPLDSTAYQLRGVLLQCLHQQRYAQDGSEDTLQVVIENQQKSRVPAIQDVAKAVSKLLGVKVAELRGATRKANVVRARGLAMFLTRKWTSLSLQQIGEYFGNRDHTTVLHACRKTEVDLTSDMELLHASEELKELVC